MAREEHLTLVTAPAAEPVSFADMQAQVRISTTDEQTLIETYIKGATDYAEHITRRALIQQTWDFFLPAFPIEIRVPKPPLSSITSIKYIDVDGATQTLATTVYQINTDGEPGRIKVANAQSWPDIRSTDYNPVTVRFVAGYGTTATSVPETYKHAIKMLAGHWFENREAYTPDEQKEVPMAVDSLLWTERIMEFV